MLVSEKILKKLANGSDVRGVTVPMAVPVMHAMAEDIRSEGGSIFFAAMEG